MTTFGAKTSVGLLVLLALLACKKDKTEPAPATTETAAATPEAAPAPEPTASAAAEASAEPAADVDASVTPVPTKVTVVNKPDASIAKVDAGKPDAATAPPANTAADYKAIMACCGALANEAKKPGLKQNQYKSAAGVCGGIAQRVKSGQANAAAARTLIRAQLAGAPVPGSC
jgi:hypothetical protein